ncbi:MAG: NADH:ubiquinone reductase (Na(+)-transporting) subunit B [Bacteroidales bacterium]|nr:NADH:ubiquinone reductase (Na(+)-transporting) subunit B [Bacteroidales bacterium]MDD3009982.1 NADH:ubiquinone reductase (Na(+)-transporting) subunit B [Bacteroidales bacterium]MDY0284709.1 NADH:ubiquinone reductase (Na(+)-transporting) subunit B [Bacteroidales bacterium]HPE86945.1 NADH:ubiquinone reductase (Na(+)-transporting) subunit B [Bacteroidales bacterium]
MKPVKKLFDSVRPHFEKGGKLSRFYYTFEAFESFAFVPPRVTQTGSHIRDAIDMKRTMIFVVIALLPAALFGMWNIGYQHFLALDQESTLIANFWYGFLKWLPLQVVVFAVGMTIEFIFADIRKHEVAEGFIVSAFLIPLILPPDIPLWMVALATAFAVLIGKEAFGGSGMNIFNPALLARVFLFFAYPAHISGDKVWISGLPDAMSGATPLGLAAAGDISLMPSAIDRFLGFIPGSIGETSTLAILLGAAFLLITGIASYRIMFSVFAGGFLMALVFNLWGANAYMQIPPWEQLIMGGFAFGAVFMATDPVSAAQTNTGKWIYGLLIGMFAVLIRVFNPAYPEGIMMAILLMNVFAPLIDHYVVQANIKRRLKRASVTAK